MVPLRLKLRIAAQITRSAKCIRSVVECGQTYSRRAPLWSECVVKTGAMATSLPNTSVDAWPKHANFSVWVYQDSNLGPRHYQFGVLRNWAALQMYLGDRRCI